MILAGLFHAAWIPLSGAITKHIRGTDLGTHSIVFSVLKTFSGFFEDGTQAKLRANALVKEVAHWSLSQCETALNIDQADGSIVAGRAKALVDLMDAFGPKTMNDPEFSSVSNVSHRLTLYFLIGSTAHRRNRNSACRPTRHHRPFFTFNLSCRT